MKGFLWKCDDSAKLILAVISLQDTNFRNELTPMPRGPSNCLLWAQPTGWGNQCISFPWLQWSWCDLGIISSASCLVFSIFPLLQICTALNMLWIMATSYRNLILSGVCVMFCQIIHLCKSAWKQEFSPAEIKLRENRKKIPFEM